jgi:hypothetical protein
MCVIGPVFIAISRIHYCCGKLGRLPCISIHNLIVREAERRRGHARRTLAALSIIAAVHRLVLVVQDVINEHMDALITREFAGLLLPDSRHQRDYLIRSDLRARPWLR